MPLTHAHRGYEYQDLLVAARLVDVMLGSVTVHVDKKLVPDDRFDDLTTVDAMGLRERTQIKYTDNADQSLTLATFTTDTRSLRLNRVISTALEDREGPGSQAQEFSFRIVLRDAPPTDERLTTFLAPANPDPGPFLPGMNSVRMRFRGDALWGKSSGLEAGLPNDNNPFAFIQGGEYAVGRPDLEWICERLVVELDTPAASMDLTSPGAAERLLLNRVRSDIGAGMYPNTNRSAVDVAEALIRSARAARQGSTVTASELLRRTQLRSDFGAVARAHPVNTAIEVQRPATVATLVQQATAAADKGKIILLVGPPGQGKSWICQQMLNSLSDKEWLVAEHYCYLGDADGDRLPRACLESIFGSLLERIAEHDRDLVSHQQPRFAADERALQGAVIESLKKRPDRRVVLIVDGIDHVTRVIGGGPTADPSFTLAEALAAFGLPRGSVLIVLSQPGKHLEPLEDAGAVTVGIPPLTDGELRRLAIRLGVLVGPSDDTRLPGGSRLITEKDAIDEFVATLSKRSAGNALYATYLCREVLRNPTTIAGPSATVRSLPPFDGCLHAYYEHIQASLGEQGAWVADVIALLDFPVSRSELKEIIPDRAHRVDQALVTLGPVLLERVTQAGVRIYHESFARFLRLPFQDNALARTALLDKIINWLKGRGVFNDSRVFRHLLPILSEADYHHEVVDTVRRDFVIRAISSGFPATAIIANLSQAIHSATCIGDWLAVVRYVEMSRSADTYQGERFESEIVGFVDVIAFLLGPDTLAERLLHNGRPVMSARSGLRMCNALDKLGSVPPWREYMTAFCRENKNDNTAYGEESDREVSVAWLRGRLRLAAVSHGTPPDAGGEFAQISADQDSSRDFYAPVKWEQLAIQLDSGALPAVDVVGAILDTFGISEVVELIGKVAHPGTCCLALAQAIADGRASESEGKARYWAARAAEYGLRPGDVSRAIELGINVSEGDAEQVRQYRARLLKLTRDVQDRKIMYQETRRVPEWIDACTVAARNDPLGLNTAEALLDGPGWYTCWLRFVISLVAAEAASKAEQSPLGLAALSILTQVQEPFLGAPRACDLDPVHPLIDHTIRRAVSLLDDKAWEKAVGLLGSVSDAISTTLSGELGGPVPRDRFLHLVVDTASLTRRNAAKTLLNAEIKNGGGHTYYADLAGHRLVAARLAMKLHKPTEARQHWMGACRLLIAYGWHKDITIYELLDPLSLLIAVDSARGRVAVAKVQALCERVVKHTDGKDTRHARSRWWQLLAAADPCALSSLIQPRLLSACNDPNSLLHGARSDLWRAWHHRADPIVAGALRLTLEEALDKNDPSAIDLLADICDSTEIDQPSSLMVALLARIDERPFRYSFSNGDEFLERDRERVDSVNAIAERAGAPRIAPLPTLPVEPEDPAISNSRRRSSRSVTHLPDRVDIMFHPGAAGVVQAIRAWQGRQYDETGPGWSVERFANILGYRILELIGAGREADANTALRLIADAGGLGDRDGLLKALAEGLERYGQRSLAAAVYALIWTRTPGPGGWMTFGGETEIESLQRATRLDRSLTLRTVGAEVGRVVSRGHGTHGVTQALIYGFAKGGLGTDGTASSVSFRIWNEACDIIADRIPWVASIDDPDPVYVAPDPDHGIDLPGDIDAAFAAAAISGLAHPSREQKRRSLVAIQALIAERASGVSATLETALSSLSDPATLTWLLRVIELMGERASPVISKCRGALMELAGRHHLTVRALARRLLASDNVPLAPASDPDPELVERGSADLLLPASISATGEDTAEVDSLINELAGVRLSCAERLLPGLREAVRKRAETVLKTDEHRQRMKAQHRAYTDGQGQRLPDICFAVMEAIEDALQRAAAGARGAWLMNHGPVADPVELEEQLATALLDDPELPLLVERTRHPRPEIPPPPFRGDPLWGALRARAEGRSVDETGVEAACQDGSELLGTIAISDSELVPTIVDGPYGGWRLVAAVEQRVLPRPDWNDNGIDIAGRYRVIELRLNGDRQALTLPPITERDVREWTSATAGRLSSNGPVRTGPVVGLDSEVRVASDGRHGVGIQRDLLTPTPWLSLVLKLKRNTHFVLDDDAGRALALITWRTEYETSDYHLAWPRLCGSGLAVRSNAFDRLVDSAQGKLVFRDFLTGPTTLGS